METDPNAPKPVFIYGAGALARLLTASFKATGTFETAGFIVDEGYKQGDVLLGLPVLGFDTFLDRYGGKGERVLVSVGYRRMRARKSIFEKLKRAGCSLPNYFFAGARVNPETEIGEGNVFCDGVIVDSFTRIGNNNFLRSNTYISHDTVVGDHNYFAPGCTFSGNCTIKDLCFFGVGSKVIDDLTIEDETFLSAGSTLLQNSEPCSQYIGYPAKKIREHRESGIIVKR
ncbi:MAG: hypothetical protein DWQ47_08345 [Acidobacteria bacterium]|nr:MAG: hypothetical protein DWQ32_16445 [Acidobacteriota bacterium]REJ99081.1 MAG: hypothetical protein DWQ38_13535 [Acidobacteriota bacterium]REK16199.1 MAG: hypothetical protein DWQ43_04155 [Acidobacteriota bacterium]REK43880.1 MAG: hypothetical protein DWQ47_08345 [Acidobacteriota bacterium]